MAAFKFQLWSDLHLEINDMELPRVYVATAPNLLLAGDIGVPGSDLYRSLLQKVAPAHERVFVIAGNHEFYEGSIQSTQRAMQQMCAEVGTNIVFMDNSVFDIPGLAVRVVGTTLWSEVRVEQMRDVACFVADFRRISEWTIGQNNAQHLCNVGFLRSEIARAEVDGVRLIVMTHHAPLTSGTSQPVHEGSLLSSAFQTDLSDLMGPPVSLWCFGHTHHCSSQVCKGTHIVSNQRGYERIGDTRDPAFDLAKVFEA